MANKYIYALSPYISSERIQIVAFGFGEREKWCVMIDNRLWWN